jgi:hypothetical protein
MRSAAPKKKVQVVLAPALRLMPFVRGCSWMLDTSRAERISGVTMEDRTMTATMALVLSVSLFANFCLVARSEIEEPDKKRPHDEVLDGPTGFELYV